MIGYGIGVGLTDLQGSIPFIDPSSLGAKLLAWWDVEDSSTLTLSGTQISGWRDKVTGNTPTQAVGGSRPVLNATAFNGRPAAVYDGIDDTLAQASVFLPRTGSLEAFALASSIPGSDINTREIISYGGGVAADSLVFRRYTAAGISLPRAQVGNGTVSATVAHSATSGIAWDGVALVALRINSTGQLTYWPGAVNSPAVLTNLSVGNTRTRIGASAATSPTNFWKGSMNSILFTQELTSAERNDLVTWLLQRI